VSQLFMVNPPGRKRSTRKKKRSAAQKAATKRMLAARKRAVAGKKRSARTTGGKSMARKRRKATTATKRRRRRSTKAKRPGVALVRRGVKVYQGNPKKRRKSGRRRSYGRNPSILGTLKQGVVDAGYTLLGGAASRFASKVIPLSDDGVTGIGKSVGVALAIAIASRKVVGADAARFITAGAMQVPLKKIAETYLPSVAPFLGSYGELSSYEGGINGYLDPTGSAAGAGGYESELGSYEIM